MTIATEGILGRKFVISFFPNKIYFEWYHDNKKSPFILNIPACMIAIIKQFLLKSVEI